MPHLQAWREAQTHRHQFEPMGTTQDGIELERCTCGAVRRVEKPETD
jgi:hypothetical protein